MKHITHEGKTDSIAGWSRRLNAEGLSIRGSEWTSHRVQWSAQWEA